MTIRLLMVAVLFFLSPSGNGEFSDSRLKEKARPIDLTREDQILSLKSIAAMRVTVAEGMGYFPVVARLNTGRIGAVIRAGGAHVGVEGSLGMVFSGDEGETWSKPQKVVDGPGDDRDPAFGVAQDGTLVLAYVVLKGYGPDGKLDRNNWFFDGVYVIRSKDQGTTWDQPTKIDKFHSGYVSPYGRIITLNNGGLMMAIYAKDDHFKMPLEPSPSSTYAYVVRSYDGGKTWDDMSLIAPGFDEVGLVRTKDNKIIAAMSSTPRPGGIAISISSDNGKTWTKAQKITATNEAPGDLVEVEKGRILLTHGERNWPMGVHAMVSNDGGKSWNQEDKLALSWTASNRDNGYPSSLLRRDGKILTLYYQVDNLNDAPKTARCQAVIWTVPASWQ